MKLKMLRCKKKANDADANNDNRAATAVYLISSGNKGFTIIVFNPDCGIGNCSYSDISIWG